MAAPHRFTRSRNGCPASIHEEPQWLPRIDSGESDGEQFPGSVPRPDLRASVPRWPDASRSRATSRAHSRGRMVLTSAGTTTRPPTQLKTISSVSRRPISAWNLRSDSHQKAVPAIIVVAVKRMALPVVAVA